MNICKFSNVSKCFGEKAALDSISLSIARGDILGYLGPNGAGKTTTIRLLLGLLRPNKGQITLWGQSIENEHFALSARKKIGFSLDSPGHFIYATAYRNLMYYARIYKVDNPQQRVNDLLKYFSLWEQRNDRVETFSKGMKQKLSLARAFIHEPELIVLDEPTASLDPNSQKELKSLLREYALEKKTAVFFSSHNLAEVEELCTKVALIKSGKLVFSDDLSIIKERYEKPIVAIELEDSERLPIVVGELKYLEYVANCKVVNSKLMVRLKDKESSKDLMRYLMDNAIEFKEFNHITPSLDDIYGREVLTFE